jgi:Family of unknown function (DUF6152)
MMKRVLWALVLVGVIATGHASAHHSYAAYDTTRIVEIEGIVEEFQMISPHSLLKVRDDNGRTYTFEWLATNAMQRWGITPDTIKTGDRVIVGGHARRDFDESRILNCRSVRRMSDGWTWAPGRPNASRLP